MTTMNKEQADKAVSLDDFDEVAEHEKGVEIELLRAGKPTRIFVTVLGAAADEVQAHVFRTINDRRRQDTLAARKSRNPEPRPIEDDAALSVDKAVLVTTGWRGPAEPFDKKRLKAWLKRNPSFISQILEASDNADAFIAS